MDEVGRERRRGTAMVSVVITVSETFRESYARL